MKPNPFVERTLTYELKCRLDRDTKEGTSSSLLQMTLVCGPRGSGKSTLVANVLEGKTGIVPISYQGSSDDEFALAVLEALKVPCPQGVQPLSLVNETLVGIKTKHQLTPLFFIEVDVRYTSKQLVNLLLLLKRFGDDRKLVKSVVVVSSSRAALTLEILSLIHI